ncbi:hypothetical protein [Sphingomonas sp. CFBP 13706]|uniref:hypothetical protein n=1 Tax=Sphingomonas sp. CFBP 13706 TaxID=2775314 RepID=UPI0017816C8C|nr:hypothetical protein [Sphingomonas sp. CFBP 13706]MBD8736208.1 hypothetical protein [Sphingomonas sp. CFBP 13706]
MKTPARGRAKIVKPSSRTTIGSDKPATRTGSVEEGPDDEEDKTVSLYGDLHGGLTMIRASSVRLVLTFGELSDGRDVLVPLVDWQTYGHLMSAGVEPKAEDKGPLLSSTMLSLDNLAFLLQDLSYDTRDAVRLLATQSKAGVSPVDERTRYAARMLRLASKHLSSAADQMEDLLEEPDEDEESA